MAHRRVCLYFGSFNPIHLGHLALARYACERLAFDEVWLLLSPLNPLKESADQLPFALRRSLLEQAIADEPRLRLCTIEQHLPAPRYTIRTLRALEMLHPDKAFSLLIGADNLLILDRWYAYERLVDSIPLYVYPRPGYELNQMPTWADRAEIYVCADAPQTDISSSAIRWAAMTGANLSHWLPNPNIWHELVQSLASLPRHNLLDNH